MEVLEDFLRPWVHIPILLGLSLIFPGEYPMFDAEIPTLSVKNW
jgi:hypothetical protein